MHPARYINATTVNVEANNATWTEIAAAGERACLEVQNLDSGLLYVFVGPGTPAITASITLAQYARWSPRIPPRSQVRALSVSATAQVVVYE